MPTSPTTQRFSEEKMHSDGSQLCDDFDLTIIVPTYNSELTIDRCLISIEEQTLRNIEVVVVDSSESSLVQERVSFHMKRYSYIRYLRAKRAGTNHQVVEGIANSRGKFVGFVDSDDFVSSTMFERLMHNAVHFGADISACRFSAISSEDASLFFETQRRQEKPAGTCRFFSGGDYEDLMNDIFATTRFFSRVLLIAKKEVLFRDFSIYDSLECVAWEDVIFDYLVFLNSSSAAIATDEEYYCVVHEDSTSNSILEKMPFDEYVGFLVKHQRIAEHLFASRGRSNQSAQTFFVLAQVFSSRLAGLTRSVRDIRSFYRFFRRNKSLVMAACGLADLSLLAFPEWKEAGRALAKGHPTFYIVNRGFRRGKRILLRLVRFGHIKK